jgi:hypothetical protein
MTFAEPVSKNRPGCRLRSMAAFDDGKEFGDVLRFVERDRRLQTGYKAVGVALAARMPGSSKVMIINHYVDDYHRVGSDHRIRPSVRRRPLYGLTVPN